MAACRDCALPNLGRINTQNDSSLTEQTYTFNDVAHCKDMLNALDALRQYEELCDMLLHVGNITLNTHKVVLAANSAYFRAMFTGKQQDTGFYYVFINVECFT